MASNLLKREYLVAYDYDSGAIWAVMLAHSPMEITDRYPKLQVYNDLPSWMSEQQYSEIRKDGIIDIENCAVPEWMRLSNSE